MARIRRNIKLSEIIIRYLQVFADIQGNADKQYLQEEDNYFSES